MRDSFDSMCVWMFNMESIDCKVKCYLNLLNKIRKIINNLVNCSKIIENNSKVVDFDIISVRMKQLSDNRSESQTRVQQINEQLKCFWPKCGYSAKCPNELRTHTSIHSSEHKYKCGQCYYSTPSNANLLHHRRYVHSNVRSFVCPRSDCNQAFKTNSDLKRHELTHSSEKPFKCDECGQRFKSNGYLPKHKRFVHSKVRQFVCRINDCNKRFKTKSQLNSHTQIHSSEKPFKCTECDKRFKRLQNLNGHKLIHSELKQFKCNYNNCGKRFRLKSDLTKHIDRHNGIKRYKCFHNNCDKSFVTSTELKSHINNKHKN